MFQKEIKTSFFVVDRMSPKTMADENENLSVISFSETSNDMSEQTAQITSADNLNLNLSWELRDQVPKNFNK